VREKDQLAYKHDLLNPNMQSCYLYLYRDQLNTCTAQVSYGYQDQNIRMVLARNKHILESPSYLDLVDPG